MAFSITEFKSNLKQGGARPSLFKVDLFFPSTVVQPPTKSEFLVRSSSIPASTIGSHDIFFHGRPIRLAGDRNYDTWETVIINDEDFGIRHSIENWMEMISNPYLNTRDKDFGNGEGENVLYKKDLFVRQFGKSGKEVRSYKFRNAFPVSVSPINLDWNSSEIEEFTCTWTYDFWQPISDTSSSQPNIP